ncbi:MAG: xylose isomerase [Ruminococcaceae bacterium]|nr:xylose isomerase [Oscillospiraceae bacterium]
MSRFKFSVGPWNVHEGADAFGPEVRDTIALEEKFRKFAEIGISAIQFHDDDVVPNIDDYTPEQILEKAKEVRALLDKYNLAAEFVAPRLWMSPNTTDGGFTSNSAEDRAYAMKRAYYSIDIARVIGCNKIVLWLAREGTLCAESKNETDSVRYLIDAINAMLDYGPEMSILIEPKPNEPIDRSCCPTIGHVMAISAATKDPARVGAVMESAHAILAGLDPAIEMGFALSFGKLGSVHLNDQNGLRYDQDKSFGAENLRSAFNQIKVLCDNNYGANGEYVGLDVKVMRTQKSDDCYRHIINSMKIVERMEEKIDRFDEAYRQKCIAERNYEALEAYVLDLLLG